MVQRGRILWKNDQKTNFVTQGSDDMNNVTHF